MNIFENNNNDIVNLAIVIFNIILIFISLFSDDTFLDFLACEAFLFEIISMSTASIIISIYKQLKNKK